MSKVLRLNLARILTLLPSPSLNVRRGRRLLTPLIHRLLCRTAGCQLCRLVLLLFSSTAHRTVLHLLSFKRGQFGGFQSCSEPSWCSQLWTWKSAVAGDLSAPVAAYQLHILSNDFQSKKEKRAEGAAEGLWWSSTFLGLSSHWTLSSDKIFSHTRRSAKLGCGPPSAQISAMCRLMWLSSGDVVDLCNCKHLWWNLDLQSLETFDPSHLHCDQFGLGLES